MLPRRRGEAGLKGGSIARPSAAGAPSARIRARDPLRGALGAH